MYGDAPSIWQRAGLLTPPVDKARFLLGRQLIEIDQ